QALPVSRGFLPHAAAHHRKVINHAFQIISLPASRIVGCFCECTSVRWRQTENLIDEPAPDFSWYWIDYDSRNAHLPPAGAHPDGVFRQLAGGGYYTYGVFRVSIRPRFRIAPTRRRTGRLLSDHRRHSHFRPGISGDAGCFEAAR